MTDTTASLSLENPAYVERCKTRWGASLPTSMIVIEYHGFGDKAFGGAADDRPLGVSGCIFKNTVGATDQVAEFSTVEAAHEAAKLVPNRREGSILGVAPSWR